MTERLGISDLMEGGLALLRKNWIAAVLIAGVAGALSIGILWVEGQLGWGLAPVMLLGASTGFLASAAFILVLGNQFRPLLSDPVELFIRCAFGLAAWSIAMVGFAAGLAFLILPGFYLLARWNIAFPLILLEGCGILEGLRRSWSLTQTSAFPLMGVNLIIIVPALLISYGQGGTTEIGPSLIPIGTMSLISAFEMAVMVFAYQALSRPPGNLVESVRVNTPA